MATLTDSAVARLVCSTPITNSAVHRCRMQPISAVEAGGHRPGAGKSRDGTGPAARILLQSSRWNPGRKSVTGIMLREQI